MSTQQRTAHLTGFNNDHVGQVPERGSFYAPVGGGAPGILGGPAAGFTLAFTLYLPSHSGNPIWGDESDFADQEFIAGSPSDTGAGWFLGSQDSSFLSVALGGSELDMGTGGEVSARDLMGVVSYIPDDGLYGGAGVNRMVACLNGDMEGQDTDSDFAYAGPGADFSLLGTGFAGIPPDELTGCRYAQFGSFWITEGIPNQNELQSFVQASMKAGEVVPAAWARARTVANPDPVTPDAPTGHHFSANNVNVNAGLGSTWTDRIGGVVLERVGTISGVERALARDPQYTFPSEQ